jgi:tripartite ATP-independent transporter DctM subunit
MRKYGYDDALNTGCIAASGLLGIMIPPSIIFMIYGVAAEQSIGKLLIAGVFPGILTAILYIAGIYVLLRFKPSLAPYQVTDRVSWKERIASLRYFWSVLLLFLTVIGGIYLGVFTPTEGAAFGVLVTLFFLLFSKQTKGIKAKTVAIRTGLEEAAKITAMLFLIMIGSTIFTTFINMAEIPQTVAHFFAGLQVPPIVLLIMILLLFIPLGMFIDAISMILITVPILIPVVLQAGFSGIWFGVLVTVMAEIASITPPVAMNVFAVKGIAPEVPIETIYKGIMPFLIVQFIILALLIAFPQISLFLPSRMM